jgi:hypothetical protein
VQNVKVIMVIMVTVALALAAAVDLAAMAGEDVGVDMDVAIHVSSSRIVGMCGIPAPTCLSGHVNKKDL